MGVPLDGRGDPSGQEASQGPQGLPSLKPLGTASCPQASPAKLLRPLTQDFSQPCRACAPKLHLSLLCTPGSWLHPADIALELGPAPKRPFSSATVDRQEAKNFLEARVSSPNFPRQATPRPLGLVSQGLWTLHSAPKVVALGKRPLFLGVSLALALHLAAHSLSS